MIREAYHAATNCQNEEQLFERTVRQRPHYATPHSQPMKLNLRQLMDFAFQSIQGSTPTFIVSGQAPHGSGER
jgi:hypothetical protein